LKLVIVKSSMNHQLFFFFFVSASLYFWEMNGRQYVKFASAGFAASAWG